MIAHYCHEWINSGAGAVNESKPIELANEVLATNDVPKTTTPRGFEKLVLLCYATNLDISPRFDYILPHFVYWYIKI